ncbi:MAG: LuxR C-terminal-related transcriptional regulator, partial [Acidobacteria bacterium]|nr:LuxR C-terminal-related transcriptional regulator [Acidobacteriota bacterium]
DGLNIFDPLKARFTRFYLDPKNPYSLSHNEITSLYEDRSGVMWIGTEGAGLNIFSRSKNIFTHYRNDPYLPNTLSYNLVWCFLEERPGILWIGTAKGLNRFDRENYKFSYYFTDPKNVHSLSNNSVRCIYRDRSGIFWLGTADVGLNKFDPQTGIFTRYRCLQKSPKELLNNIVRSIAGDKMGLLWIGTSNGLYSFDTKKESFTNTYYTHDPNNPKSISDNLILYLCEDDTGALWIATQWGGLNKFNPETKSFAHYMNSPNSYNCLSSNVIICIYQAKSGTLWIGTGGGGLNKFHRETGTFTHYTTKNGLPNDTVYGILEDDQENLWLSTNKGLSCFNPVSEIFKNYNVKDGIQGYEFNSGAFYKSSSGEMFFGGQNGFNSFYPDRIEDNKHVPHLVITNLKLSNKTVDFKSNPLLKKHISYTDEITLSYRDNIFTIYFAALEFTNPAKNQYKYMMEGLHKNWINLGHQNNISFTGLEPGKYIFRVTGSNNDGIWNQTGTSLKIIITPPFWKTWWFRAICIVAILMLFFAWHKQRMANLSLQLKSEAEMERLFEKHNISSREREIIHLILKGKTNKDIEDVLYISVRTVKNHIYNIYQKFGVNSRLELIHEIQKSVKSN